MTQTYPGQILGHIHTFLLVLGLICNICDCLGLRWRVEDGALPDRCLLRAQAAEGEQGDLPPRGLRRQVHGDVHEVHGGHMWRLLGGELAQLADLVQFYHEETNTLTGE